MPRTPEEVLAATQSGTWPLPMTTVECSRTMTAYPEKWQYTGNMHEEPIFCGRRIVIVEDAEPQAASE